MGMDPDTPSKLNPSNKALSERDVDHLLSRYGVAVHCLDSEPFVLATTHKSYRGVPEECREGCMPLQKGDYERLEHLGDSVVELAVTHYLHQRYFKENEAFLTQLRMKIVSGTTLASLCAATGLNRWIIVSAQADAERARERVCIMEDVFEAFCGALFLTMGYPAAHAWISGVMEEHLDFGNLIVNLRCTKDRLVRHCQRVLGYKPRIMTCKEQDGTFGCQVLDADGTLLGQGNAKTLKEAEVQACQYAWEEIVQHAA